MKINMLIQKEFSYTQKPTTHNSQKNPLPINPEHTLEHTIYLQVHIKISTVLEFLPYVYKINFKVRKVFD